MKIAMVSIYPKQQTSQTESLGGVASYTKNLATALYDAGNEIHVICNTTTDPEVYSENGIHVHRVFSKKWTFIFDAWKTIHRIRPDVVHVQQELHLYGNIVTAYLLPFLLWSIRKPKTIVTIHGVVALSDVTETFVREQNSSLPTWIVKTAFYVLNHLLCRTTNRVIVHEERFKRLLETEYNIHTKNIFVIPHGVNIQPTIPTPDARKTLNILFDAKCLLFMGYYSSYKGIEFLVEAFSVYASSHPDAFLLIAAGKHPKLQDDPAYQEKYTFLQKRAKEIIPNHQYRWVGFIPDDQIPLYYSACDALVLPYTYCLASSGPMAIALGYGKPIISSTALRELQISIAYFESTIDGFSTTLDILDLNAEQTKTSVSVFANTRAWKHIADITLRLYG